MCKRYAQIQIRNPLYSQREYYYCICIYIMQLIWGSNVNTVAFVQIN